MSNEINLKETLNLPQTDFPIRAGLASIEPELLEHWKAIGLEDQIRQSHSADSTSFTLHDGPPYPNGDIHLGHALNKVLKDIVNRSKTMAGYLTRFVPGWDCHGLPIEVQLLKKLKKESLDPSEVDIVAFRNECKSFATDYVSTQKESFKRLGISAEWDRPYLTLNPEYEAAVVASFGAMAENGLIYKGRKPIHWSIACETALAEAEIEYQDHRSPSITVKFTVSEPSDALANIAGDGPVHVLVWTTTPWTLPSNVAIAAHPDYTYVVARSNGDTYVMVDALVDRLSEKLELADLNILGSLSGSELVGTKTQHPFYERASEIYPARYVTKEDGTGFVHIAPGHGQDDYLVGLEFDLPILMPVNDQGKFTKDIPEWEGMNVFDANKPITQLMQENGALMKLEFIKHSYPHCWRSKTPVIFRATEQWFVAMDTPMPDGKTLRQKALAAIEDVTWFPDWGEKRLASMIENRPDWCISRQRSWGIPIPVFHCKSCDHSELSGEFNAKAVEAIRSHGSNVWFEKTAKDILSPTQSCSKCGGTDFSLDRDILDVWFESGASFASVISDSDIFPAQLYLEGSDQHRGWFQSSLLIGLGSRNSAPYEGVLTHGFLVDEKGKKMSKSIGNTLSPEKIISQYGADILRWWVASSDFKNDIHISASIMTQARDTFSKVRNTIRFLLSNLSDFDPEAHRVDSADLCEIDRWILGEFNDLIAVCREGYDHYDFHVIAHRAHDFCAVRLSAQYLDMTKDRLYCDDANSDRRRSSQTAMYLMLDGLLRLLAPILVFTCEDAYRYFQPPNKLDSIHLCQLPTPNPDFDNSALSQKWTRLLEIKDLAYQELEQLRKDKVVKSFLEASVDLQLTDSPEFDDWESLFIVSHVSIAPGNGSDVATASIATGEKCQRCWKVKPLTDDLCSRCGSVVSPLR